MMLCFLLPNVEKGMMMLMRPVQSLFLVLENGAGCLYFRDRGHDSERWHLPCGLISTVISNQRASLMDPRIRTRVNPTDRNAYRKGHQADVVLPRDRPRALGRTKLWKYVLLGLPMHSSRTYM